jgi:hypothetical protein
MRCSHHGCWTSVISVRWTQNRNFAGLFAGELTDIWSLLGVRGQFTAHFGPPVSGLGKPFPGGIGSSPPETSVCRRLRPVREARSGGGARRCPGRATLTSLFATDRHPWQDLWRVGSSQKTPRSLALCKWQ